MINYNKPYFNNKLDPYEGIQPFFYDNLRFNWCTNLQDNSSIIKEEFLNVYNSSHLKKLATDKIALDAQTGWNQAELLVYGLKKEKNIALFPKTYEVISHIKNISTCYFSILKPGTQISAHIGDTDAYYRFHFGLIIPEGLPGCGIQVGCEKRAWKENDFIVFNDIYKHTAWNNTNQLRVVLIIDVLREFENITKKEVESKVLSSIAFSRLNKYLWWLFELAPKFSIRIFQFLLSKYFLIRLG